MSESWLQQHAATVCHTQVVMQCHHVAALNKHNHSVIRTQQSTKVSHVRKVAEMLANVGLTRQIICIGLFLKLVKASAKFSAYHKGKKTAEEKTYHQGRSGVGPQAGAREADPADERIAITNQRALH